MPPDIAQIEAKYAKLRTRLQGVGWISQGYVQNRGPGAGGPCYQWTRKVRAKTVSVALSKEQYEALRKAIDSWKQLEQILHEMQVLSSDWEKTQDSLQATSRQSVALVLQGVLLLGFLVFELLGGQ